MSWPESRQCAYTPPSPRIGSQSSGSVGGRHFSCTSQAQRPAIEKRNRSFTAAASEARVVGKPASAITAVALASAGVFSTGALGPGTLWPTIGPAARRVVRGNLDL